MSHPLTHLRARRPLHAVLVGTAAAALAVGLGAASASAATVGKLVQVSHGDPFADCTADQVGKQPGTLYPATEIEPWVTVNPADPTDILAVWQQDRWSDAASRGLIAGVSSNGGSSWKDVIPGKVTKCEGGPWTRASDPWADFTTKGVALFMHLVTEPDLPNGQFGANGMIVTRSTDGGQSWGKPITLVRDPAGQTLNDKNSITADPKNPNLAYAVWDRLTDFTLPPQGEPDPLGIGAASLMKGGVDGDGVVLARERAKRLSALHASGQKKPIPTLFKGPAYLSRTTDGGRTWSKAELLYDPGPNAQTLGNQIVVTPDGTLYNFFTHFYVSGAANLEFVRSRDKGRTWEKRSHVVGAITAVGTVTPDLHEPVRDAADLFDVAVDPRNGNLYAVWQDARYRQTPGIDLFSFSMSTDGGRTWSLPIAPNQTPFNPDNIYRNQAFIPSVEIAPDGEIVMTYYDYRNDNNKGELADYWALICDPGKVNCANILQYTSKSEVRLTGTSFDMLNAPIARGHFLGDYQGLDRVDDGVLAVFGIATGKNKTDIYARRVIIGSKPVVASAQ